MVMVVLGLFGVYLTYLGRIESGLDGLRDFIGWEALSNN
jgi:hypothetical protein